MPTKRNKSKSPPKDEYRKQHIPKALREQCWVHNFGKKYKVHLPTMYSDKPGKPVNAVVVPIPFSESYNPNTREVVNK